MKAAFVHNLLTVNSAQGAGSSGGYPITNFLTIHELAARTGHEPGKARRFSGAFDETVTW